MASASFGMLSLLIAILSGGATDMLDFVSSDAYWKAKNVTISVDQLLTELKPVEGADISAHIRALGAGTDAQRRAASDQILAHGRAALPQLERAADDPDPEVASRIHNLIQRIQTASKSSGVRRLVAIRTLGEKKDAKALPTLRPLLTSTEPFVADYAARAIAEIENKPLPVRGPDAEQRKADLALLPPSCGVVGQISFVNRKPISLEQMLADIPREPGGADPREGAQMLTTILLSVLESIGNVRVEAVTFGVADDIGPNAGFATVIIRGQYDRQALTAYLRNLLPNMAAVDGADLLTPDGHTAIAFVSDTHIVAAVGPAQDKLPVKELVAAVRAGKAAAPAKPEITQLVAATDTTARMWAVAAIGPAYRGAEVIKAFDTVTLVGKEGDDLLTLTLTGTGADPAVVKSAADQMNRGLDDARRGVAQVAEQTPFLKPVRELLDSVQCRAEDKTATLTGTYRGDPAALMIVPVGMFGMRATPRAAPPVAPPPPAPVEQRPE